MKKLLFSAALLFGFIAAQAQQAPDKAKIKEDLDHLLSYISYYYVYLPERGVDINCLRSYYTSKINDITTQDDAVLLFEYLLDEFHDTHLMLNTNVWSSYRLYAPLYASLQNNRPVITSVWTAGTEGITQNIIGAEVLKINGVDTDTAIANFPTHCNDKNNPATREWIVNKIIAGRYSEPRVLMLKLASGKTINFDPDQVKMRQNKELLSVAVKDGIGIITLNNSLGNNNLIAAFDAALDSLSNTKGLVIDLRNAVDGGNSYVARGIMSRFTNTAKPYQKHSFNEQYDNGPAVARTWLEYVQPRGTYYGKPTVALVGRWTGSMGEGLAIGLESVATTTIVGTEMERLAGEMSGFPFKDAQYGFRISTARLFHVNGTPREKYVPAHYVAMTTVLKDETLEKGIGIINEATK